MYFFNKCFSDANNLHGLCAAFSALYITNEFAELSVAVAQEGQIGVENMNKDTTNKVDALNIFL